MKILITSIVDINKTAHNRLHQFIKHLSKKNEITVLCINDWWKLKQTDVNLYTKEFDQFLDDINVIYLTNKKRSPILQELFSYNAIRNLNNIDDFDVHFNYNSLITGYFVSKKMNLNVYDIADDLPEMIRTSPQIPFFLKTLGAILGAKMLQSNIGSSKKITYITDSLKEDYNLPTLKAEHIPNGVDTELFRNYSSESLKSSLDMDDTFIIGYVGVLREWVDLEPVFRAMKQLGSRLNIKMLVVGEEGYLEENKKLVEEYGLSDKVIFTGTVPYFEVPKYASCMDVCLIPFKNDAVSKNSLPLKLFEYMACEKPVISTRLPGVLDAVGNRVLYASNDGEFSENILHLYNNKELGQKLGFEGRKFVEKNYDWSVICHKLEKILEESLS